jgi:hypothetical protein
MLEAGQKFHREGVNSGAQLANMIEEDPEESINSSVEDDYSISERIILKGDTHSNEFGLQKRNSKLNCNDLGLKSVNSKV